MDEDTLKKLEFDEVREALASFCATALGKRLARSITPATKQDVVREWLGQVRELTGIAKELSYPPMAGVHDIREEVRASAFPAPLEADALARVAETLAATAELRAWFARLDHHTPILAKLSQRIDDLSPISRVIGESIDSRGRVRDDASPKLASIRQTIENARKRVKSVFDRMLRQTGVTRMLQYSGTTFHDDRMVLPLKTEHRGRIRGIIHRSSDSGSTLFVEPAESVELNNTITRLRDEESKEITRILRGLTQRVQMNAHAIVTTLRAMAVVDLIAAKCRYAEKRSCCCPTINTEGVLDLHDARHPLLVELWERDTEEGKPRRDVVPIDVRLGDDFDILVITGPNTGGKTVALKTVGLLALMTQCGIPIPAGEGSQMPVFRRIHIDVGDEQSLQQSLSTFSSHLSTILRILQCSDDRSLVLIDELGAGTDPDEGAAIGRAVLAELLQLHVKAIVTTHLSTLKAVAFTTPRVDNAAVDFDNETLQPTYHLRLGEPGNSNALIIAKRLGMSARLVKLAKDYLADSTQALNRAIAGTLHSRRQAEQARKSAREAVRQANQQREQYEREGQQLRQSQEAFERWTTWVSELKPGDAVYLRPLKRVGRVVRVQLHKQTALVTAGSMDIEVALRDVAAPRA